MSNNTYCVIMAGGIGVRFWPLSRRDMPKQFLDILGTGKSLIRHTFERFEPMVGSSNILVVTNARYKEMVLDHLPELSESQILCEPIGRNTAPCIAYAAHYISKIDPNANMIVTPSDHYITNEALFSATVSRCLDFASSNSALVTIGIKPNRPECGYGYIQVTSKEAISRVKCFTEKPNLEMAKIFVDSGEFVWNSGIFIWSVKSIVEAFEIHLPECNALFAAISEHYAAPSEPKMIDQVFSECKSISIDYGVMEKADNVYVTIGEFGWSDVGTWSALFDHAQLDENGNISSSDNNYLYNTHDSIISVSSGKRVVVSGLSNYIVVDSPDTIMICPRGEEQNIKNFIEDIKYRTGKEQM